MDERYNIQVLERAFRLMDVLLQARTPLSLETLATRSQMPKSTAFRIISNLIRHGYLCETDEGYWLGLKMISFGQAVDERLDVRAVAAPYLSALRDKTNETVYLAILTQDWAVMYLDKYPSRQLVGVTLHAAGMTIELYCTALGKVLAANQPQTEVEAWLQTHELISRTPNTITTPDAFLAEIEATRQRGYGIDNAERSLSIRCVAAPICNAYGKVIAAISVAGPSERMPNPLIDSQTAYLALETAQKISTALGMPTLLANGTNQNEEVSQ